MILAIDPGTTHSGVVLFANGAPASSAVVDNRDVLAIIADHRGAVAIEKVVSYGMAIGQETIDTIMWIGRFLQVAGPHRTRLIPRKEVCKHVCNDGRAKDANIRQALIDKWGGKAQAIGNIKQPGPLYSVKSHAWAALAVAVTAAETKG